MTAFFVKLIAIVLCWGIAMAQLVRNAPTKFSYGEIPCLSLFFSAVLLHAVLLMLRSNCQALGGCKKWDDETKDMVPAPCELERWDTAWHLRVAIVFVLLSFAIGGLEIYSGPGILLPPNAKFVGIENVVHEDDWKLCYASSGKSFWPKEVPSWKAERLLDFCGKPADLTIYLNASMKPDAIILDTDGKLVVKSAVTDLKAVGEKALDMVEARLREIEVGFTSVGYTEVLSDTAIFETGLANATEKLLIRKLQKAPLPKLVGLVYAGEVVSIGFAPPSADTMDTTRLKKASKSAKKPTT